MILLLEIISIFYDGIGGQYIYSMFVIENNYSDEQILIGTSDGYIYSLDNNGNFLWKEEINTL